MLYTSLISFFGFSCYNQQEKPRKEIRGVYGAADRARKATEEAREVPRPRTAAEEAREADRARKASHL